ncbi:MAG: NAD(P)/FAD-dependent oxidoreductase [Woeseiaceae bacterium]
MKNIIVVGGGFAGLWAALGAARQNEEHSGDIDISLVSPTRYLTIRPRLYEANPRSLRVPLRATLDPVGVSFIEGVVNEINHAECTVTVEHSQDQHETVAYSKLILAAGSTQKPLPLPRSTECTWNIDTCVAAVLLDKHLRQMAQHPDAPGNNTIVIIGGGFTGIELATEMRTRIAIHADAATAAQFRVVLVEQSDVIGPDLGAKPRPEIERALKAQNIEVRTGTRVAEFDKTALTLDDGTRIDTTTAIVTAGLQANALAARLPVDTDELGRLPVDENLRVQGVNNIFAAGDIARAYVDDARIALMSCQHAMPMGRFAGYNATRELLGLTPRAYRQPNYVTCLDLGAAGAIFTSGWERRVDLLGDEAKQKKRIINTEWIYPPTGDKHDILAMADIDYTRKSSRINR